MIQWGRRKDNKQAYPKSQPKGVSGSGQNTSPTSDIHLKTNDEMSDKISQFILHEKEHQMKGLNHAQRELQGDDIETDIRSDIKGFEDLVPHLDKFALLWKNLETYLKEMIVRIEIPELTDPHVRKGLVESDYTKLPLYDRLVLARGMKEELPKSDLHRHFIIS